MRRDPADAAFAVDAQQGAVRRPVWPVACGAILVITAPRPANFAVLIVVPLSVSRATMANAFGVSRSA